MRQKQIQKRRLDASVAAGTQTVFFSEPREWRRWLEDHHAEAQELWVGLHKKSSGRPSITWPQAVDEALCFGWIEGVRKSIDDTRYQIRFTPRRARSIWSNVNIGRARALSDLGLMAPAGLKAFRDRTEARSAVYMYEQRGVARLDPAHEKKLKADRKAWGVFPVEAAGLPQAGHLVGDQRKAGTDSAETTGEADRRFTQRANHSAADPQAKVGVDCGG